MKTKRIAIGAAVGLAAIISACAPPEIKPKPFENKEEPGITRIDYFDGSFELKREEPQLSFRHNEAQDYDFLDFNTPQGRIIIADYRCDGIADQFGIESETGMDVSFRYEFGKERLFEKASSMLKDAKKEIGL